MTTKGVHSVLDFYSEIHEKNDQKTVVITLMDYDFNMQQLAQPIAFFDFLSHSITKQEKELIFPPFCDFSLKTFELSDIKNEFYREVLGARMWKLARANSNHDQIDKDIKLLWVTKVTCVPLYEQLKQPLTQAKHSKLEDGYYDSYIPSKTSVYKNIEFWNNYFHRKLILALDYLQHRKKILCIINH
jgi:hypothetical protein